MIKYYIRILSFFKQTHRRIAKEVTNLLIFSETDVLLNWNVTSELLKNKLIYILEFDNFLSRMILQNTNLME